MRWIDAISMIPTMLGHAAWHLEDAQNHATALSTRAQEMQSNIEDGGHHFRWSRLAKPRRIVENIQTFVEVLDSDSSVIREVCLSSVCCQTKERYHKH
jgi:hypothetical protein